MLPVRLDRIAAASRRWLLAGLLAALAGCSHSHPEGPSHRAIFSPNGEPLSGGPLGFPACEVALSGWLDRLDTAHRGTLTRAAFLADARRQFAAMDLNHDGVLTPDVLLRYREPYTAGVAPEASAPASDRDSKEGQPGHMKKAGSGRTNTQGAALARDVPDPVMSADTGLKLRVTAPDFEQHAGRVFDMLDVNQDGLLSRAELQQWCSLIAPAPEKSGGFLGLF